MQTEGGASPKNCFSRKVQDALKKMKKSFFVCARSRQGGTAGVEIRSGGLEMPVLVDSAEACTSGLTREVC